MAAIAVDVMSDFHWSLDDHAEERDKIKAANARLEAWARWQRSSGINIDYPKASAFVRVMTPAPIEEQAGARHVAPMPTDEDAMEVDRVLAGWRLARRRYWKIIHVEYRTGGSSEQKARRCGMCRADYRARLARVQLLLAETLDAGRQR